MAGQYQGKEKEETAIIPAFKPILDVRMVDKLLSLRSEVRSKYRAPEIKALLVSLYSCAIYFFHTAKRLEKQIQWERNQRQLILDLYINAKLGREAQRKKSAFGGYNLRTHY